jgi:hypothetical protein
MGHSAVGVIVKFVCANPIAYILQKSTMFSSGFGLQVSSQADTLSTNSSQAQLTAAVQCGFYEQLHPTVLHTAHTAR